MDRSIKDSSIDHLVTQKPPDAVDAGRDPTLYNTGTNQPFSDQLDDADTIQNEIESSSKRAGFTTALTITAASESDEIKRIRGKLRTQGKVERPTMREERHRQTDLGKEKSARPGDWGGAVPWFSKHGNMCSGSPTTDISSNDHYGREPLPPD